jgi:uncharacterized iron-regulated protein
MALSVLAGMALLAPGAGGQPAGNSGPQDFDDFKIVQVGGSAPVAAPVAASVAVDVDKAADMLAAYDVIFVGEYHDHLANHLAELALLRALRQRAPALALSMEQFERDTQPAVDDYLAGRTGEASLKREGRAWRNYDEAYRPLVEYAKDHGLPVIAANAPENLVRCVGQKGASFLESLPAAKRGWAAATLHTEDGVYKQKFLGLMNGDAAHGGALAGDRAERSFAAQVTRDDTMAESIANFLQARPGAKVMHVTGAFHVEDRLGTIERLKLRAPQLKIAMLLPVQSERGEVASIGTDQAKGADFVILVRREPEPYASDKERQAAEAKQTSAFRTAASQACKP